jgi:hypothetical protein
VQTKCFEKLTAYASCSDEKGTRITEIHPQWDVKRRAMLKGVAGTCDKARAMRKKRLALHSDEAVSGRSISGTDSSP